MVCAAAIVTFGSEKEAKFSHVAARADAAANIATETTDESKITDFEFVMALPPNPGSSALGRNRENPTATD
jgi:hypothetical protein